MCNDLLCQRDARNFNANAAPAKPGSYSKVGGLSAAAADVNMNWNAGDAGAAPESESAAVEDIRKVSITDNNRKTSVPDSRKVSAMATHPELDDTVDLRDAESVSVDEDSQLSDVDERSSKLRRSKASQSGDGELSKAKARTSRLRLCIRRCIAEDETWDLKTVPDLDMLVVKHIADNYAGIFMHAHKHSAAYTCRILPVIRQ